MRLWWNCDQWTIVQWCKVQSAKMLEQIWIIYVQVTYNAYKKYSPPLDVSPFCCFYT